MKPIHLDADGPPVLPREAATVLVRILRSALESAGTEQDFGTNDDRLVA